MGHSLGTAIAELGREGAQPRGTVLMSAFSSVRSLIDYYYLFGFLPHLKSFSTISFAPITWSLVHLTLVPDIKSSVLIAHADNDWDIPSSHSSVLFDAFLTPHVSLHPITPENPLSQTDWDSYTLHHKIRASKRSDIASTTLIEGYGVYEETDSDFVRLETLDRKLALLRIESGGMILDGWKECRTL